MKKKIFVLLILLLLTGCKAKYNLQINFGGNFIESGTVSFNSTLKGKGGYPSTSSDFLKQVATKYGFTWINKKVSFDDGNYFGYNFYQRYPSANSFANRSPALKAIFNTVTISEKDHYVKLETVGYNNISTYHKPTGDFPTTVEGIEINVQLPYKVVKHNATSVDANTNTYTWRFDGNTPINKGIDLEYRDNELYTYNPAYLFQFVSPYVYIAAILIIVIIVVAGSLRAKAKFRNRI